MARTVQCPFCYGSVTIESDEMASHSLPTCKVFDESMGADDFAAKVRTGDAYAQAADGDES